MVKIMQWKFKNKFDEHQYPSLLPNARTILTFFGSTYLYVLTFIYNLTTLRFK